MPIAITLRDEEAKAIVAGACARRQVAELRCALPDGRLVDLRTLLISLTTDGLAVERPVGPAGPVEPAQGNQVHLTFSAEKRLVRLEAEVLGPREWTLETGVNLPAIELKTPHRVCELQRRADYRIPLLGPAPVMAHFEPLPTGTENDDAPPEPFHAELKNISAGGVAAVVSVSAQARLETGQHYTMKFFPLGGDKLFTFAVEIQHIRQLVDDEGRLIGLKFMPGNDGESYRQAIQEIRSFVDVQRRLKP
jgi:c-di-GMP-binding flagellar brake protein YcgR